MVVINYAFVPVLFGRRIVSKKKDILAKLREKTADELVKEAGVIVNDLKSKRVGRHFGDSVKSHELRALRIERARMLTIATQIVTKKSEK